MKRKIVCLLLSVIALPAYAEDYQGGSGWSVTFNGKEMTDNFKQKDINDSISNLQPGDSVTFTVSLSNTGKEKTDWYMTNKVLRSLEDTQKNAAGGGYTYLLTYTSAGKTKTLFSSDTIGAQLPDESLEGLHQATNALEEFFFLDELSQKESGVITLKVALDGETQGNAYQDTLADLQMNFAVEMRGKKPVVPTGDTRTLVPYVIACGVSGLVLLALAILSLRARGKDKKVTEE